MEHIWQIASTIALGVGSWFLKMLHSKIEDNLKDLAAHKLHVAENYAKHTDLKSIKEEIQYVRDGVDDIKNMLMKGKK